MDALNYSIAIDSHLGNLWKTLEPHNNVFLANSPGNISNNISIPKPVISTISNWLETIDPVDPVKLERMYQLFNQ